MDPSWPSALIDHLRRSHGEQLTVDRLGGMSGAGVWRVAFQRSSVVVKVGARSAEAAFYRRMAEPLRSQGVPIPTLERMGRSRGTTWLVLEDVPDPLPKDRSLADRAVLTALRRLHAAGWERPLRLAGMFRPTWTEATTAAALAAFPHPIAAEFSPLLDRLRTECLPLFRPACFISGDPNPNNWGVRASGEVVLFDWERFGRGTPALDLAITVPGLGDADAFRLVAARYLATASAVPGRDSGSLPALARAIGLAKVWSVAEFLASHDRGSADRAASVADWLIAAVPDWLRTVYQSVVQGQGHGD